MKKDFLILAFIITIVSILFAGTKFQTVEDYYMTHADDITADSDVVTLTITANVLEKHPERLKPELQKFIPRDGLILKEKQYVLRRGDTVFDILQRATRQERIQMEYQGANESAYKSVYIQGINYLYEFSAGERSGWMYRVNKKFPSVGVSRYKPKNGDKIEFIYTTDLGNDIGGAM